MSFKSIKILGSDNLYVSSHRFTIFARLLAVRANAIIVRLFQNKFLHKFNLFVVSVLYFFPEDTQTLLFNGIYNQTSEGGKEETIFSKGRKGEAGCCFVFNLQGAGWKLNDRVMAKLGRKLHLCAISFFLRPNAPSMFKYSKYF